MMLLHDRNTAKNRGSRPRNPDKSAVKCRIEAVLSVDARGQVVLPKEVRKKANIKDGDKLALVSWTREDNFCCFALMRTTDLSPDVTGVMRSLLTDID